jgi:surface polysaccharide O-acyltransferase-like enzyme
MILNEYATYYLLGYWFLKKKNDLGKKILLLGILATGIMVVSEIISLKTVGETYALNHQSGEMLTLIQTISVFLFIRQICEEKEIGVGKGCAIISKYSFAIYLVHPFFINLIYKILKITPLSFPIGIGIVMLYAMVVVLSLITAMIMKRIPIIKNII